jgi:hypothetical protein
MLGVVHARLICTGPECTDVYEAWGRLEELEALACDCGCALEIVGWPDPLDEPGDESRVELQLVA